MMPICRMKSKCESKGRVSHTALFSYVNHKSWYSWPEALYNLGSCSWLS